MFKRFIKVAHQKMKLFHLKLALSAKPNALKPKIVLFPPNN